MILIHLIDDCIHNFILFVYGVIGLLGILLGVNFLHSCEVLLVCY